jgi:phenylalanyl-tRNA synthetase alpha chain
MQEKFDLILQQSKNDLEAVTNSKELFDLKTKYLGKNGEITALLRGMKDLSPEQRSAFGKLVNDLKTAVDSLFSQKEQFLKEKELQERFESEAIDITLPGEKPKMGSLHPLNIVKNKILNAFCGMGFEVFEGPEIESDYYCFQALNIPKDHPARDMQDTFYINENLLLRTHTSPVQARTMEKAKGQPVRIICPGKTYRRDDDDATHSHQFAQIEGLLIDENINIGHLKATLELFAKKMFGEKREIRLRPSYFPFTEPSVEVDITCSSCGGKGCSMCKGTGYIEVLGAGMVHPNVLKMSGYDPEKYSGFAFGIGIERVAILRYGIDDIRKFYQNDVRFLHQFKKKA